MREVGIRIGQNKLTERASELWEGRDGRTDGESNDIAYPASTYLGRIDRNGGAGGEKAAALG